MTPTVEGDERLRLFLAFPLPASIGRERLVRWQAEAFAGVADIRVVPPENLHVTLVFLGSRLRSELEAIDSELRAAAATAAPPVLEAVRYRETGSVGMVELGDEGGAAARLQADLSARLDRIGVYRPEKRTWTPHVTVVRFRRRPRLRLDPPELGRASPSEVGSYTSRLRRDGAQYEIRASVPLGG
jgi:2'-5' RNA ligase